VHLSIAGPCGVLVCRRQVLGWTQKRMTVPAKYEKGVFRPLSKIDIREGTVVEVHVPTAAFGKPPSVRELDIAGMWADRDDIADGIAYVNRLRDNPRGQ
jgi:hypothetical protein